MDYKKQLLLKVVELGNILPVTSICNTACIFCSHRQNPPQVQTDRFGHLKLEEVDLLLPFLDAGCPIVIGESATRLIEGEPFTHPSIMEIIKRIRITFPHTPISITTNGTYINNQIAAELKALEPVTLYLSINCSHSEERKRIMGIKKGAEPDYILDQLAQQEIPFHGSMVGVNWLMGWSTAEDTVAKVEKYGGKTMRVFLPGYTRLAAAELRFPSTYSIELKKWVDDLQSRYELPITLEPSGLKTLSTKIVGVIKGSPAMQAGLQKGDLILTINGEKMHTGVDAFFEMKKGARLQLEVMRQYRTKTITLRKKTNESSGVVMDYDLSGVRVRQVADFLSRKESHWLMASSFGVDLLKNAVADSLQSARILEVKNEFFGGSIGAAGLLTVEDFLIAYGKYYDKIKDGECLCLPAIAFDHKGQDLTGRSYLEIKEKTAKKIKLL